MNVKKKTKYYQFGKTTVENIISTCGISTNTFGQINIPDNGFAIAHFNVINFNSGTI